MELFVTFFRDTLSGFFYFIYLIFCIFFFFYVYGFVAKRKRNAINEKLKEKKQYDIESGREAQIAAMETKQVLDVDDDGLNPTNDNPNATLNNAINSMSGDETTNTVKEKVPNVMVLNSNGDNTTQPSEVNTTDTNTTMPEKQEPLVIDTSSVQ